MTLDELAKAYHGDKTGRTKVFVDELMPTGTLDQRAKRYHGDKTGASKVKEDLWRKL